MFAMAKSNNIAKHSAQRIYISIYTHVPRANPTWHSRLATPSQPGCYVLSGPEITYIRAVYLKYGYIRAIYATSVNMCEISKYRV